MTVTVATKALPETMRLVEQTVEQQRLKIIISSDDASGHKEWKLGIRSSFGVGEVALLTNISAAANVFDAGAFSSTTPEVALAALQSGRKAQSRPARSVEVNHPGPVKNNVEVAAPPAWTADPGRRAASPSDSAEVGSIYSANAAKPQVNPWCTATVAS